MQPDLEQPGTLTRALRELPDEAARPYGWSEFQRRAQQRTLNRRSRRGGQALAALAVLALGAIALSPACVSADPRGRRRTCRTSRPRATPPRRRRSARVSRSGHPPHAPTYSSAGSQACRTSRRWHASVHAPQ